MCFIDSVEYRLIRYISIYRLSVCIDIGFKIVSSGVRTWVPVAGVLYTCRFEPSSSQLPSTQINKCMPSLYSTYVYKQYIACSRQAFTWNSWFERKLLSYCGGVRTCMGSTPPRSSHPPCGAFSSNVSSSQVNTVITLCKASGHYTC